MKAPAHFAAKGLSKYDWKVERNQQKTDEEYDVIIVGSGIGGLACGALWENGPIAHLPQELGLEDMFVRNTTGYIFRGGEIEAENLEEFMELLSDTFPEERKNILAFFREAEEAHEESYSDTEFLCRQSS